MSGGLTKLQLMVAALVAASEQGRSSAELWREYVEPVLTRDVTSRLWDDPKGVDAQLYASVVTMISNGERVDRLGLYGELVGRVGAEPAGAVLVSLAQATEYAGDVDTLAVRARACAGQAFGVALKQAAHQEAQPGAPPRSVAVDLLSRLAEQAAPVASLEQVRKSSAESRARALDPKRPPNKPISTGVPQLDGYMRHGYGVGKYTVFALGPNGGKSMITSMVIRNMLFPATRTTADVGGCWRARSSADLLARTEDVSREHNEFALIISLEDSADDLHAKLIMDLAGLKTEDLDSDERRAAVFARPTVATIVSRINDALSGPRPRVEIVDARMLAGEGEEDGAQLSKVRGHVRRWAADVRRREAELGHDEPRLLVMIDYLQKLQLPEAAVAKKSPEKIIASISLSLQRLAERLHVAVVMTAMLNGRTGDDARTVSIRESASVEQDCDVLIKGDTCKSFSARLEWEIKHGKDSPHRARYELALNAVSLILDKTRGSKGKGHVVTLRADFEHQRLMGLTPEEDQLLEGLEDRNIVAWARAHLGIGVFTSTNTKGKPSAAPKRSDSFASAEASFLLSGGEGPGDP
jgi:replicative DNA helicase